MAGDLTTLLRRLRDIGYTVDRDGSNHYRVIYPPNKEISLTLSSSPSDPRWRQNFLALLRRNGLPIPEQYEHPQKTVRPPRTPEPLTQRIVIPDLPAPKPEVKEEEPEGYTGIGTTFEMYIPTAKAVRLARERVDKVAGVTITASCQFYINTKAVEVLGRPARINISINASGAEMMIWADTNGYIELRYEDPDSNTSQKKNRNSATFGGTELVKRYDLPKSTKWTAINTAPGRVLVQLTGETRGSEH